MEITKRDIKRIAEILQTVAQLKIRLSKTSDEFHRELIEFKLFFYQSELLKYPTDLIESIQHELNNALSIEEIAEIYDTERNREIRKRKRLLDEIVRIKQEVEAQKKKEKNSIGFGNFF